jgi:hypothetical protein
MPTSVTDGSGQLIKTGCKYLCEGSRPLDTPPTTEDWAQHPALNIAIDGIAIYANWVSRIVMPIAFLWINDHKDEICRNEHWDKLPDDVNEVVNAAFEIAKEQHYYKDSRIAFYEFQQEVKAGKFRHDDINPNWAEKSKELRAELHKQFHVPGRLNKVPPVAV